MTAETAFNTPAILLRRVDYGDADLILTVLTPARGKLALIAKAAKRSRRRFGGVLDLFVLLDLSCRGGRGGRMPLLTEAVLQDPFAAIRGDIVRTAYASYWIEMVHLWGEDGQPQPGLYRLLHHALAALDRGGMPAPALSLLFQIRFLRLAGIGPRLDACVACRRSIEALGDGPLGFDPSRGAPVCTDCGGGAPGRIPVRRGTLKQLLWVADGGLQRAARMRFSAAALREGEALLEAFVSIHIGREPRSLEFLRHLRTAAAHPAAGGR